MGSLDDVMMEVGVVAGITMGVLVIFAFILLGGALRMRAKVRASQSWPSTIGRVTEVYVDGRTSSDSEGGTSISYYPVVVYTYSVMGQSYEGRRITLGTEVGGSLRGAEKIVDAYSVGSSVTVYYDDRNPADAVLDRSAPASRWFVLIAVLIIAILMVVGVVALGMTGWASSFFENLPF